MNFTQLLSLGYWFNTRPDQIDGWLQPVFITLTILLIAITAWSQFKINKKEIVVHKLWGKLFNFSLTNAIIGVLLIFFNLQSIPLLMARFWYALWFVWAMIWLFYLIKFAKKIPIRKAQLIKQKEIKKYQP